MFNLLENQRKAQMEVFVVVMRFACECGQFGMIEDQLNGLDSLLESPDVDDSFRRRLFNSPASILKSQGSPKAMNLVLSLLRTYQATSGKELGEALPWSAWLVAQVISRPEVLQFDEYVELASYHALNDGQYKPLYSLMHELAEGDLRSFQEVLEAHGPALQKAGVDADAALHKMRLLSLASLASAQSVVSFDQACEALQVPAEEVESWVIEAVAANVVDANIDDLAKSITFTRASERVFTPSDWNRLHDRMQQWRDNLTQVLAVLDEVNPQ
jgi:translation initiation factor 3 subunit M